MSLDVHSIAQYRGSIITLFQLTQSPSQLNDGAAVLKEPIQLCARVSHPSVNWIRLPNIISCVLNHHLLCITSSSSLAVLRYSSTVQTCLCPGQWPCKCIFLLELSIFHLYNIYLLQQKDKPDWIWHFPSLAFDLCDCQYSSKCTFSQNLINLSQNVNFSKERKFFMKTSKSLNWLMVKLPQFSNTLSNTLLIPKILNNF